MKRIHLIIHGLVQGVFFRYNTMKEANRLGLKGYAKNLSDGTVEVVAEGSEDNLDRLIEFCKVGSEMANVNKVEVKFEEFKKEFGSFEINY